MNGRTFLSFLLWHVYFAFGHVLSVSITFVLAFYCGVVGKVFLSCYLIFMVKDIGSNENTLRGSSWLKSLSCWHHIANYFPVKLIKTVNLPPTKNYLFVAHPHGCLVYGYLTNFSTKVTTFHEDFPGIKMTICGSAFLFKFPFFRELLLSLDVIAVTYRAIVNVLSKPVNERSKLPSNAALILLGGIREFLYSSPGCYKIVIKNRKGFVRAALETGASIVPVFSFGEVDSFDLPMIKENKFPGTFKYWPRFFKRHYKFALSKIIPNKSPINTVVGAPIDVQKVLNPSQEMIDEIHEKFMRELEKLFNEHKIKYLKNPEEIQLEMV